MPAATPDRNEVTVASYLAALTRFWWVIAGLVVLGIAAGVVYTLTQPDTYDATASVYIGQTTDANGNPMASLNANAKASVQLVTSDAVLQEAAEKAGIPAGELAAATSVETPSQTIRTTQSIVNLVVITVRHTSAERAAAAANALADALLARLQTTPQEKVDLLREQVDDLETQIAESRERAGGAAEALAAIAAGGGSRAEKAAAAAPYIAISQAAATDQSTLATTLQKAQLMLVTAENIELPRLLHEAAPPKAPSGPDLGLNAAAGALAGFVIGVIAAFVLDRRRLTPS